MKLGLVQFQPILANLDKNMAKLEVLISKAHQADLLVLPELANSGYNFKEKELAWNTSEEIENSKFVDFLEAMAKKNNQFIVSGFNERLGTDLFNTSILIGPNGYVGKYQKIHLFKDEKDFFQPGEAGLPVFDLGFCKIGVLICYDYWFPEVWRILSLKGVHVICHPSNLLRPGMAQRVIPVHAMLNKIFIATANRTGEEDKISFCGLSIIACPKGDILYQASESQEEVKVIDIDIQQATNKFLTRKNHIIQDRKVRQYTELTDDNLY